VPSAPVGNEEDSAQQFVGVQARTCRFGQKLGAERGLNLPPRIFENHIVWESKRSSSDCLRLRLGTHFRIEGASIMPTRVRIPRCLLILAGLVFLEANRNVLLLPDLGSGGVNPIDPSGKFGVSPNALLDHASLNRSGVARIDQHDDGLGLLFFGHGHYDTRDAQKLQLEIQSQVISREEFDQIVAHSSMFHYAAWERVKRLGLNPKDYFPPD